MFLPLVPLWRVDSRTNEAQPFPAFETGLTIASGSGAPIFRSSAPALTADGYADALLFDGQSVALYRGAPNEAWRRIGRGVREVEWVGWSSGAAVIVASEAKCDCFTPLTLPWSPVSAGVPAPLVGTSLQFLDDGGDELFSPIANERLEWFPDSTMTCALTHATDGTWAVYDVVARTRTVLGRFDYLNWVTDAP